MANIDQLVAAYIALRNKKKAMQDKHKEELAPIIADMNKIEAGLLGLFNDAGVESMASKSGTAYKKTLLKATVVDREVFFDYVRENKLDHMLSSAVSSPAVREFIEANGEAPPGVAVNSVVAINIRK